MITMLNSWSFELNSNKSFGPPDPSIPIPSHGHPPIVGDEVTSRFLPSPLGGERVRVRGDSASGITDCLELIAGILFVSFCHSAHQNSRLIILADEVTSRSLGHSLGLSQAFGTWLLLVPKTFYQRASIHSHFVSVDPVNFVKTANRSQFNACNLLIARVCTVLHVNQNFFSKRRRGKNSPPAATIQKTFNL